MSVIVFLGETSPGSRPVEIRGLYQLTVDYGKEKAIPKETLSWWNNQEGSSNTWAPLQWVRRWDHHELYACCHGISILSVLHCWVHTRHDARAGYSGAGAPWYRLRWLCRNRRRQWRGDRADKTHHWIVTVQSSPPLLCTEVLIWMLICYCRDSFFCWFKFDLFCIFILVVSYIYCL